MASFNDKWVKCPFYSRDDSNGVICEGILDDTAIRLMFQYPNGAKKVAAKKDYMADKCMDHYQHCPIYKMLTEKYR